MAGRIVVFGATGFTGRLVTAALVGRGERPVVAGRHADAVAALAAEHGGLPSAVADATRPETVRELLAPGDTLVTTVGPFERYGGPVLDAAIAAGAHYVDSTGEPAYIRRVFAEAGPRALAAGVVLLPAFGFDYVPGNLAGGLAARAAGPAARRLDVGYFFDFVGGRGGGVGASSGSLATGLSIATGSAHLRRAGALVEVPVARQVRAFADGRRRRTAIVVGGTEPITMARTAPQLTDIATYVGAGPALAASAAQVSSYAVPALLRLPLAGRLADAVVGRAAARTGHGPDAAARARSGSVVIAVASDADGHPLATVRLVGPNAYDLTGSLMADAAARLAAGGLAGAGALGPAEAYGLDELEAACAAAGLRREAGGG